MQMCKTELKNMKNNMPCVKYTVHKFNMLFFWPNIIQFTTLMKTEQSRMKFNKHKNDKGPTKTIMYIIHGVKHP